MSLRPDGTYHCDRCGISVGNAAVTECSIVSDMKMTDYGDGLVVPTPRQLHFCRVPNAGAPDGCTEHLLVPSNLADYLTSRETSG